MNSRCRFVRSLRYWILSGARSGRELLLFGLCSLLRKADPHPVGVDGIRIIDVECDDSETEKFNRTAIEALRLIEKADDLRWRKVKLHVQTILNNRIANLACYLYLGRICIIDWQKFSTLVEPPNRILALALVIVHESSHGRIEAFRIPFTKDTKDRIERLCHLEEQKFQCRVREHIASRCGS